MTPTTLDAKVDDFLAQKRIAVVGVSRNKSHHPVGHQVCDRLKSTGHDVFPVNPHLQTFEGDRCYPDLRSIPGGVDGVVIITRPEITERIVRDCARPGCAAFGCIRPWRKGRAFRPQRSSIAVSTISP